MANHIDQAGRATKVASVILRTMLSWLKRQNGNLPGDGTHKGLE